MKQSTLFSMTNNAQRTEPDAAVKNKEKVKLKSDDKVGENVNPDNKKSVSSVHLNENKVSMAKKQNQSSTIVIADESDHNKSQEKIKNKQMISYEDFISENIIDQSQSDQTNTKKHGGGSKNHVKTTHDLTRMDDENDFQIQGEGVSNNNSKGEDNDKQSISYKDFLGMFKPASSLRTDNNTDSLQKENSTSVVADQQDQDEITNAENCEKSTVKKEVSGCKSIASFFKPVTKKKDISVKNDAPSTMITVTAEVHITPSSVDETLPKGQRSKKEKSVIVPKSISKKSEDDGNAIILLGSETICDDKSQDPGTRKRKLENERDTLDSHSKKKKTSLSLSKSDKCVDKKDSKSISSCKTNSPPNSNHTGQCRLSFGASGLLTIKKQQPKQFVNEQMKQVDDEKDKLKPNSPTKTLGFETKEMITEDSIKETDYETSILNQQEMDVKEAISSTNSCENISSPSQAVKDAVETTTPPAEGWKPGKLRLRGRKSAGTEEKLDLVNVQSPEKVEVSDNDQSSKVEGNEEQAETTPILRRSTRVRQSTSKKVEVIEVDDDEEDKDKKQTQQLKLKEKRKNSSSSSSLQQSSEKSEGSQNSKVMRKLAPIFTRLKPAQAEVVNPPPPTPEELEKLKARQEFLMSGIPDELKRVQAAIALQSVPEYPPFPSPSHVQQIDRELTESICTVDMNKMRILSDTPEMKFDNKHSLDWNQLQWSKPEADHPGNLWFQNFSSHPELDQKQVDLLMRELEKRDQTFPFREALNTFLTPKNASQTIGGSRTSEQEDVIVIDDSLPCVVSKSKGNSKRGSRTSEQEDVNVIVIDDSLPCVVSKSKGNLRKRIPKSTSQKEVIALDDSGPVSSGGISVKSNCHLWTDEHPKASEFILGNGKVIKQLRGWLEEWHTEMQREAKKALKGTKSHKSSRKKAEEWSDDSDFTDSSAEDDTRLCNTMLITGPHGVGKTSTIYCLAQELGFKVFEVNPTSLRSGKQLQSQLEEATQSHRVVQSSTPGSMFGTPPPGTPKDKKQQMTPKPVEKPPVCKAFSGFFKKLNSVKAEVTKKETKKKPEENNSPKSAKKRGRKKKQGDSEIKEQEKLSATNDVSTSLNITSASIILFDEADIVLEDDKGFLATVQHFMSSTKIPIVITSTNPTIHWELSPRHEHIIFKPPPVKTLSSFLHTVCLARGLRISHKSLLHLASVLKQDVRRCLLFAQYWCESGGGKCQADTDPQLDNISKQEFGENQTSVGVGSEDVPSSDNSNHSEFLSLRPARKRQKRMVFADDSNSNSNCSNSEGFSKNFESLCHDTANTVEYKGEDASTVSLPCVHLGCDVSLIGEDNDCGSLGEFITDLIKRPTIHELTNVVNKINHIESYLPCHAVYNLAAHCCSLPKTRIPTIHLEIPAPKSKTTEKKRKRIMIGDWFDSDGSDEDDVSKNVPGSDDIDKESVPSACLVEDKKDIKQNDESLLEMSGTDPEKVSDLVNQDTLPRDKAKSPSSLLSFNVLNSFSNFYENHSSMQYLHSACDKFKSACDKRYILPGISDEEVLSLESEFISTQSMCQEICGSIELLSARTLVKCVDESLSHKRSTEKEDTSDSNIPLICQLDKDQMEEMTSLPIGTQMPDVWSSFETSFSDIGKDSSLKNVTSRLGSWSQGAGSKSALHLDYLPVLREICRAEQERQAANMKRRFNHYLDHIGLNLKESTLTTLSTMYSVARN